MMCHRQEERENTMKKSLIIALAICLLFLIGCSSLVETSTPSPSPATYSTAPIATASTQSICQVLHDRQVQLNQDYHATNAQLAKAQAGRNMQQAGEAEQRLIRLHQSIVQVQAQLKAC
jgi:uncharacterized lipoprotein YajG